MRPGINGKKTAAYLTLLAALVLGIMLFIVQSRRDRGNELQNPASQAPAAEGDREETEKEETGKEETVKEDETAPAPKEEEGLPGEKKAHDDREIPAGAETETPREKTAGTGGNAGSGQPRQQPEGQKRPSQTGSQGGSASHSESRPSGEEDGGNVSGQDTETPPVPLEAEPADTPPGGEEPSGQPSEAPENTESQKEPGGQAGPSEGGGEQEPSGTDRQDVIELPEIP